MITIICIYNNEKIFQDCLLKSLENQTAKYERIFIDNTSNIYNCAAKAFNKYCNKAHGEYLMFIHQDIIIQEKIGLKK